MMNYDNFQPIIKWSGSKRSQSREIIQYFPKEIDTYYEPFCGGCSMMRTLLTSDDIRTNKIICSDLNGDLVNLWRYIKENPERVFCTYKKLWSELNQTNRTIDEKRSFFEEQREIYNKTHDPLLFFFIMRTTTNGMPRYNSKGEFNNSFHITRDGIKPDNLYPILMDWSDKLNRHNVKFRHCGYGDIFKEVTKHDFLYLDPPYANVKKNTMYFGSLDFGIFFDELKKLNDQGVKYVMSFDGKSGNEDNTYNVPETCYVNHLYVKSGNSSFKRTTGNDKNAMVYESLYLNFDVEKENGLW